MNMLQIRLIKDYLENIEYESRCLTKDRSIEYSYCYEAGRLILSKILEGQLNQIKLSQHEEKVLLSSFGVSLERGDSLCDS